MSKITPGDDKNIVQNWDSKHLENFTTLCENEIFFSFQFMIPEPPVCYLSLSKIVSDTFGHFPNCFNRFLNLLYISLQNEMNCRTLYTSIVN